VGQHEKRGLGELQGLNLLEQAEAERYARRSRWSLQRAVKNGLLRRVSGGRRALYERTALDEWIRAGRPTSEGRGSTRNQ
jgi:hypothetical protein